ncbi:uncharacterized protein LOC141644263 [Silene latifolia]|uniref:uncharacterized protein LOC141644263 n=1 Tax=Silene latifolia TaxID=37657 RepID=UPI003D7743DD
MEVNNYPLTCWWNGEVVVNGEDISYKGGCETFVLVSSNISFNELKNEIYESLEVDRSKFELNIKMKFPSVRGYKVVSLNNDRSLKALWAIVCQSKAGSMDLFIELKPIVEDPNLSFTNMFSQVEDPNWHVSLSSNHVDEVAIDGNIFGDEIENGIEEEDALLLLSEDDMVDLVSQPCTNTQFIELGVLDVGHENSWYKSCVAPFKSGEEFSKGQDFASKELLRQVVTTYNVARNQVYKIAESRPHTVTYKCNRQPSPCSWYLRATKKNIHMDVFTIVSYEGPHEASCVVRKPSLDHPNLRGEFISNAIKHLVKEDWGAKVSLLRASITKEFNFKISYWKTWMAKQRAMADLYGDWEESYAYLPRYLDALKEVNPGTAVHFVNKPTNDPNVQQFDKVFWSFGPSIKGFPHCRPIITIDGTHLYGKYSGTMLIAMGVDANEQLEWYRKITRLVISPLSADTQNKDLYEKRHNFYPNAADNMLLSQGHVYNYERATTMLGEMPDGVPLSHVNMVKEMQSMSLECLHRTGQGHLILPTEADHPSPPHNEPRRYDLRHRAVQLTPIQEEATPSGSTSRQKGKRPRSRLT